MKTCVFCGDPVEEKKTDKEAEMTVCRQCVRDHTFANVEPEVRALLESVISPPASA